MNIHTPHIDRKVLIIIGLTAIIFGLFAIIAPVATGVSMVFLVGMMVTGAGIARMYWAFKSHQFSQGALLFSFGGLTFAAGLAIMLHPVAASALLTIIITLYFILDGISELYAALVLRPNPGWLIMAIAGAISILLGIMLWSQFPLSGAWAIGILLGIKLLFIGFILIYSRPHPKIQKIA